MRRARARRGVVLGTVVLLGGVIGTSGLDAAIRTQAPSGRFPSLREAVSWGRVDSRLPREFARGGKVRVMVVAADNPVAVTAGEQVGEASAEVLTARFAAGKRALDATPGVQVTNELPSLNVTAAEVDSVEAMVALANNPGVERVVLDEQFTPFNNDSRVVVRATTLFGRGLMGAGAYVGVIDTGADITSADLGPCSAPGVPADCNVAIMPPDFSTENGVPISDGRYDDSSHHGTNVASIVARLAPQAKLIVADVFGPNGTAFASDIAASVQYFIGLKSSGIPIRSVNLSLGIPGHFDATCSDILGMGALIAAGIVPVAAAGNDAITNAGTTFNVGLSNPACVPGVLSVGATYDQSFFGPLNYASCSDPTPNVDTLTCFSQTSPSLSLVAPGAMIDAGGYRFAGTSQASPHVAAAVAVLASAVPSATVSQLRTAVVTSPTQIFDSRIQRSFPRLDYVAALEALYVLAGLATPDFFDYAAVLNGASGSMSVAAGLTAQPGEPSHGNRNGIRSTWFKWTAPATGQASFSTAGSTFDTAMSVYTGSSLGQLTRVAADDDTASTSSAAMVGPIEVTAGTTYRIAVTCGTNVLSCGTVHMAWSSSNSVSTPANDFHTLATVLTGSSGTISATTAYSGAQLGEPSPVAGSPSSKSVWFRIPGVTRSTLTLSTAGSNFDTVVAAYAGSDPASLVSIGANNDVGPTPNGTDLTSRLSLRSLSSTESYWIAVDSPVGQTGTAVLSWNFTAASAPASSPVTPPARSGAPQTPAVVVGPRSPAPGLSPVSIQPQCLERGPATGSYLILDSPPGDSIGGGRCWVYSVPASWLSINWAPGLGRFDLQSSDGANWSLSFAPPQGQNFSVGTYTGASRYPFGDGTTPTMDVSGDHRGCNTLAGSFSVTQMTLDAVDRLSSLDLSFEQLCQGSIAPLRGVLKVRPFISATDGSCLSSFPATGRAIVINKRGLPDFGASGTCYSTVGEPAWAFSASYSPSNGKLVVTAQRTDVFDYRYVSIGVPGGGVPTVGTYGPVANHLPAGSNVVPAFLNVGAWSLPFFSGDDAGSFTINSISFGTDGTVAGLDLTFEDRQGGSGPPVVGRVRF